MSASDATTTAEAVLVSGASSGIGRATAEALASRGYRVFAGVRRPEDADALRRGGWANLTPVMLDVTDQASIDAAVREIETAVGSQGLYALVNNAGIALAGPLEYLPIEQMQQQFEVNLWGMLRLTQAFLPLLRQANGRGVRRARIVNIGSVGARAALPLLGAYAASKAALCALNEALRIELRPWNLFVTLIEPGSVVTAIVDKGLAAGEHSKAALSGVALAHYQSCIEAVSERIAANNRRGISAEVVARTVLGALEARTPKARYLVGAEARLVALLARYLPEYWRDALLAKAMGLPARGARQEQNNVVDLVKDPFKTT